MYKSIDEIKAANKAAGNHFFDTATMRFFRSRVASKVHPTAEGAFFVTSEQRGNTEPRLYTTRYADSFGRTHTVAPFYGTSSGHAHNLAATLAALADKDHEGRGVDAIAAHLGGGE